MLSNNQLPENQDATDGACLEDSMTPAKDQAESVVASNEKDAAPIKAETQAKNDAKDELLAESAEKSYTYRWSYADQSAFDKTQTKTAKSGKMLQFALVMFMSFAAVFALLFCVLMWNGSSDDTTQVPPGDVASYATTIESIKPSTVLIETLFTDGVGYGTGFFVRSNGYIATNYHLINGGNAFQVTLYSGEKFSAQVIGYSVADDIAVLKIEGNDYPVLAVGDSDALKAGDRLIGIGHPGGSENSWSAVAGIVSAVDRTISVSGDGEIYEKTMIQTDAALNGGNSGGPLCNINGQVIGIITRKSPDKEGMAYALPINGSMDIINTIIRDGHGNNVVSTITKIRPTMGIQCYDILKGETYGYGGKTYTAEVNGVQVAYVTAGGGAEGALQVADIIIAIDSYTIDNMQTLKSVLCQYRSGDQVQVTVIRGDTRETVTVTLGK